MAANGTLVSIQVTFSVTGGPGNPRDFVGIYRPGTLNNKFLAWKYLANNKTSSIPETGASSGTVDMILSSPTATYEIRFISISSSGVWKLEFSSQPFTFGPWPSGITFAAPPNATVTGKDSWKVKTTVEEGNKTLDISNPRL